MTLARNLASLTILMMFLSTAMPTGASAELPPLPAVGGVCTAPLPPSNVTVDRLEETMAYLIEWEPPPLDEMTGVAGYVISRAEYRPPQVPQFEIREVVDDETFSFVDNQTEPDKRYLFEVAAFNECGMSMAGPALPTYPRCPPIQQGFDPQNPPFVKVDVQTGCVWPIPEHPE